MMWFGQKKDGKTGFGGVLVSKKLFVVLFSRVGGGTKSVLKFGEKGFSGTRPLA